MINKIIIRAHDEFNFTDISFEESEVLKHFCLRKASDQSQSRAIRKFSWRRITKPVIGQI